VWKSTVSGRVLHFHLAGINNQNFLMRDEETASWWQQVTGKAVSGALKGAVLEPMSSDELTFGLWKSESPAGVVLAPVAADLKHYESDWEAEVAKLPVVVSFKEKGMGDRDVVIGVESNGASRAYPLASVMAQSPISDRLGGAPIVIVLGPDGKSVRAFFSRVDGFDLELFRKTGAAAWTLIDSSTRSEWNFQGCATQGTAAGKCLGPIAVLKDYWFDWRNYHPNTSVYRH
jgi:Protein of unknown function (DUF3179)